MLSHIRATLVFHRCACCFVRYRQIDGTSDGIYRRFFKTPEKYRQNEGCSDVSRNEDSCSKST